MGYAELEKLLQGPYQDIHKKAASELFGVPYNEVTPVQRTEAKRRAYSRIYGSGKHGLR